MRAFILLGLVLVVAVGGRAISDATTPRSPQLLEFDTPTYDEQSHAALPRGFIVRYPGTTAPSGWLFFDGATIGNSQSSAMHAGAHFWQLFDLVWRETNWPVSGGRGASAAEDFAAGKVIGLPLEPGLIIKL